MVINRLARRYGIRIKKKYGSRLGQGSVSGREVILAVTNCFMNVSGETVRALADGFGLKVDDLIIVHDDLDIAQGNIKLKRSGGDAGHKGIKSIIDSMGTRDFTRIRIGIGRPASDQEVVDYVLGRFNRSEIFMMEQAFREAVDTLETLISKPDSG
jgi:PTH1 family peptidyl-tRNA hydrolase